MDTELGKIAPPSDDKRWKLVDATMRRYGHRPDILIEALHTVQESFGFLSDEALEYVARALRVPFSRVYGVATFYHYFNLKPQGKHTCVVCTGTACYIKGVSAILKAIEQEFGIKPGQTTEDNEISLLTARCLGSCGLAPAAVFDSEVGGKQSADDVIQHLRELIQS